MRVGFSRRAEKQIEAADRWRREHGVSSIRGALDWLVEHLALNPDLGEAVEDARRTGLRRWPLSQIQYSVYYLVDRRRGEVTITEIRHAKRRPLRM